MLRIAKLTIVLALKEKMAPRFPTMELSPEQE